jgi:hypothetical protein
VVHTGEGMAITDRVWDGYNTQYNTTRYNRIVHHGHGDGQYTQYDKKTNCSHFFTRSIFIHSVLLLLVNWELVKGPPEISTDLRF